MTKAATREKEIPIGHFLPMLTREFQIAEITIVRAKKDKRADGVETMPIPEEPASALETGTVSGDQEAVGAVGTEADKEVGKKNKGVETDQEEEMEIAISSEFPVRRWYGTEILDHSAGAVDLSRAKRGLSFLAEHDARDLVGIIEKVKIDDDKKLRGIVRFSNNAPAQAVKRDIQDGIRRFISVGYQVNEYVLETSSDTEGDTYRATRWTPLEASSVAVPADPTVGHNRNTGERKLYPVEIRSGTAAPIPASKPNQSEVSMETQVADARTAAAEIFRLGKRHGVPDDVTDKMVRDGVSVEAASSQILSIVEKRGAQPLPQPGAEHVEAGIQFTEREQMEYNLARGIMAMVQNRELSDQHSAKRVNTFELEVSEQIEKTWSRASHGGLFVPWTIRHAMTEELQRKFPKLVAMHAEAHKRATPPLTTVNVGGGKELVFTMPGEFIEYLYNRMFIKALGAQTIAGLRDNVSFPKQTGSITGYWMGESPASPGVPDSALTLAQIPSSPKTYMNSTSYSRQLLAQAVIDVDTLVREDMARNMALAIDSAAINGTGPGNNQPTGIMNTTGVQLYTTQGDAGNGGPINWNDVVIMTEMLENVNADQLGAGAWLTTPSVKSQLKRTPRLGNVVGFPIWADDSTVDGYQARATNQVPKNMTEGTGTGLSAFIRGIFETMVIGMWGNGFELVVDPYSLKKQGLIELTTFMLTDVVLKYPVAFVVAKFVNTTTP